MTMVTQKSNFMMEICLQVSIKNMSNLTNTAI